MKLSIIGSLGMLGVCFSVVEAGAQMGAQAPKKSASPTPTATPSSAVLPVAFFRPASTDKPEPMSYATQAEAMLRCMAGFQLRTTNQLSTGQRAFCSKTEDVVESKRPSCPSGWGYLITDDQLVPAAKAKFGKGDQCFRSDSSSRKKEDLANYVAPNCVIGANGVTGGFELAVKEGADACERTRQVEKTVKLGAGAPVPTNQISPEVFDTTILAGCPGGSALYVDLGERTVLAVTSNSWPANSGAFCKRN